MSTSRTHTQFTNTHTHTNSHAYRQARTHTIPGEVEADAGVRALVDVLLQLVELLDLHERVAGLRLRVVVHQVRNDVLDELVELLPLRGVALVQRLPLLRDLARQVSAGRTPSPYISGG